MKYAFFGLAALVLAPLVVAPLVVTGCAAKTGSSTQQSGADTGGTPGDPSNGTQTGPSNGTSTDAGTPTDAGMATNPSDGTAAIPSTWLAVQGTGLVDQSGTPVRLLGVNLDGLEYMCIQGRGIFDSPSDASLVSAIVSWNANVVRLSLNEQCWLGVGTLNPSYSGTAYQQAIEGFVALLRSQGLWVIIDVHESSSVPGWATAQRPMLDVTYGLPFWNSVAQAFQSDRGVVFDAFNEPFLDTNNTQNAFNGDVWQCWLLGCQVTFGETYISAGMQQIIDEIRSTGAANVIMLGGLAYANDLTGMLSHMPTDSLNALVASFHMYSDNNCNNTDCWSSQVAPVAAAIPVVTGEIGQMDCGTGYLQSYMPWADANGVSYLGWTFNPGPCTRPSLVSDYSGTPTTMGAALHDHLVSL